MEYIGKELMQISKLHRALLANRLAKIDLFPGQDALLYYLSLKDGQTMSELVEKLQIQHATLFNMVERMGKTDLVTKIKDDSDMRTSLIYLTDKGRECLKKTSIIWKDIEKQLSNGLSEFEKTAFLTLLSKISANIIAHK